jgi:hypothetical protein
MKGKKKHAWFSYENVKEKYHLEEVGIDGTISEWLLEK